MKQNTILIIMTVLIFISFKSKVSKSKDKTQYDHEVLFAMDDIGLVSIDLRSNKVDTLFAYDKILNLLIENSLKKVNDSTVSAIFYSNDPLRSEECFNNKRFVNFNLKSKKYWTHKIEYTCKKNESHYITKKIFYNYKGDELSKSDSIYDLELETSFLNYRNKWGRQFVKGVNNEASYQESVVINNTFAYTSEGSLYISKNGINQRIVEGEWDIMGQIGLMNPVLFSDMSKVIFTNTNSLGKMDIRSYDFTNKMTMNLKQFNNYVYLLAVPPTENEISLINDKNELKILNLQSKKEQLILKFKNKISGYVWIK